MRRWFPISLPLIAVLLTNSLACRARAPVHPNAVELNRLAALALAQGDLDAATARLSLAVEYHPEFVEAWVNLGVLHIARGEDSSAERYFRRALAIHGDASGAHVGLGVLAEHRADAREAEKCYRRALAIDPALPEPRANLARLLVARNALDEARDQLRRLIEVQADDAAGWVALAEVLWRLDRDPEASDIVNEATLRLGSCPEVALLHARRDIRRRDFHEAISRLEGITSTPGGLGRIAGGWLALARLEVGDRTGAKAAAKAVLARDPEDSLAKHVMRLCSNG